MPVVGDAFKKNNKIWIIVSSVAGVILASVLLAVFLLHNAINNPKIGEGIRIGEVYVGGMTAEEAYDSVLKQYQEALNQTITLRCEDVEEVVSLTDLAAEIDKEKTVDAAFQALREGNFFNRVERMFLIKKEGLLLPPAIRCDEELLNAALQRIIEKVDEPGQEMQLSLGETELTITKGFAGICLNQELAAETFKNSVLTLTDGVLTFERESVPTRVPVAKELYEELCGEPQDATYTIENYKLNITEHKNGVQFDVEEAQRLIDQATGDVIVIPVVITPANVTTEKLNSSLFSDVLGSYSTRYNAGDTARSHNVSLASQKINEIVLAPGAVFSYNDIVGPRTTARGFRVANVYVGNKVEPGVGGGICQVSSTLFNAVVLADLKIEQRVNHSLPVSYVPLGRDATVSYGSIDFKFSNNTQHPVKIVASASRGTNYVAVYGVKENKDRTIAISTECIGTRPATLVQREDANLPEGTVKVEQAGSTGSTYNTYKIIKEKGQVVKTEFLTKSTYVPGERIEIIGTGPVPSAEPVSGEMMPEQPNEPGATETPTEEPAPAPEETETTLPEATEKPDVSDMFSNPAA